MFTLTPAQERALFLLLLGDELGLEEARALDAIIEALERRHVIRRQLNALAATARSARGTDR